MEFGDERESSNIEDRRGARMPGGRVAVGGIGTVLILLVGLYFGVDPGTLLNIIEGGAPPPQQQQQQQVQTRAAGSPYADDSQRAPSAEDPQRRFVAQVLASTEDVWSGVFQANGGTYQPPILVLFSGATPSACGFSEAAVGPFYCPRDHKLYLDMDFLRQLQAKLGANGDFAEAYVIAHEVGHHVQTLLGTMQRVAELRARGDQDQDRQVSVRVELQADCFAGIWANRANAARGILQRGDIEQGINAAGALGDDRIQMRTRGYVVPESFTHGSGAQRARWFRAGLDSGDMRQCDTFGAGQL